MGLINRIFSGPRSLREIGAAARNVAEVFRPNATTQMTLGHEDYQASLAQYGQEFQLAGRGWFDRLVDALNRLPRPALALGTLGLFVFAMVSPERFSVRMQGLAYVPEPLWWLLGAVVSFYFGAREMHYSRDRGAAFSGPTTPTAVTAQQTPKNAALEEWRQAQRR